MARDIDEILEGWRKAVAGKGGVDITEEDLQAVLWYIDIKRQGHAADADRLKRCLDEAPLAKDLLQRFRDAIKRETGLRAVVEVRLEA